MKLLDQYAKVAREALRYRVALEDILRSAQSNTTQLAVTIRKIAKKALGKKV